MHSLTFISHPVLKIMWHVSEFESNRNRDDENQMGKVFTYIFGIFRRTWVVTRRMQIGRAKLLYLCASDFLQQTSLQIYLIINFHSKSKSQAKKFLRFRQLSVGCEMAGEVCQGIFIWHHPRVSNPLWKRIKASGQHGGVIIGLVDQEIISKLRSIPVMGI